jgi:Transposase DDE domain
MLQTIIQSNFNNKLEKEINKVFRRLDLPMHSNKTGNKEFTNYQRISIIILFHRSKKSLRQFIEENLSESKWVFWLGLKKVPTKSTIHRWIEMFNEKIIRKICRFFVPEKLELTSIDSTGIDAWQRSRHYEKRCAEFEGKKLPPMDYAKTSLFIDVKTKIILDWDLVMSREHDVKIAERIFKRNSINGIRGLGDKGYDSEPLHEIAREHGIEFFAPTRKMNKRAFSDQRPKGFYRRQCKENPPEDKGMRSISENVNSVLKGTQITSLRSKKDSMRQRELGWHIILYNIKRKIKINQKEKIQTFLFLQLNICSFWDRAEKEIIL